ncbi:polysaccharide biosynthesis/export family protein [Mesorhizobium newzealandense]|uniref:Polysaccharide biosynthesis/export family protein n=1 Tax=Mesorhizobium newzealandense TaxID=1300302 RepID=A0ABW4U9T0_9HYPH
MDHVQRSKADCHSPAFHGGNRRFSTMAASFHDTSKRSRGATISLIPFCLILLFGAPARGQSETDDRLVPQDTVELKVSGWDALRGGVTEGVELNGAFTIDTAGTLDLPVIGHVPALGLHESELAKLITDRLQARSGFDVRPVTTVQRSQSAASSGGAKVEGHPPGAPPDVNGSRTLVEAAATGLERERSKTDASLTVASLHELSAVRKELEAARQQASADRQSADKVEQVLRSELQAAREQLDTMRRVTADAGARARAIADATTLQGQALDEQKQRAERLARDLATAQREVESLQAKAALAIHDKAAALGAHQAAEASLSGARRALDEERQKVERFERDLATAHQSLDALEASGKLAVAAQVAGIRGREVAEAAAKRAGEALALERGRADALERDLDAARQDRDAAKDEVARLSAALEQQRERAFGLARDLAAARNETDILKARDAPRDQRIEPAPKAPAGDRAGPRTSALAGKRARSAREPERREIRKVVVRKSPRPVRLTTISLPAALLPTRAPLRPAQGIW